MELAPILRKPLIRKILIFSENDMKNTAKKKESRYATLRDSFDNLMLSFIGMDTEIIELDIELSFYAFAQDLKVLHDITIRTLWGRC